MGLMVLLTAYGTRAETTVDTGARSDQETRDGVEDPAENGTKPAPASTHDLAEVKGQWRSQDVYIYTNASWTLEITYLNRDTRSEGQQGRLLENGKPVNAEMGGESLDTPLGLIKYYGSERTRPWDVTGWNFADRRKIRRASELPRPPEKPDAVADPAG